MGLWLGVSVVQIFSYSVTVASAFKISVFKKKKLKINVIKKWKYTEYFFPKWLSFVLLSWTHGTFISTRDLSHFYSILAFWLLNWWRRLLRRRFSPTETIKHPKKSYTNIYEDDQRKQRIWNSWMRTNSRKIARKFNFLDIVSYTYILALLLAFLECSETKYIN